MPERWKDFHEKLRKNLVMADQPKKEIFQKNCQRVSHSLQGRDGDRRIVRERDWKRGSMEGKPFHLTRNVSGISNRKFCRNGKRLCCPFDCFI